MTRPRRAVVHGTGRIARRHLENLRARCAGIELAVVRRPGSSTPLADLDGVAHVLPDLDAALAWGPDVAVVASPSTSHVPIASRFVGHGVHVLIEKPLAARAADAVALRDAMAAAPEVVVSVGYNLRHHAAVQALAGAVHRGDVGRPLSARAEVGQHLAQWRPHLDPRASVSASAELGGGALLELSHEMDYLGWVLGPIRSVSAACSTSGLFGDEVEDIVDLLLRHDADTTATIHLDMVDRWPGRRCRVVGELGTVLWDSTSGRVELHDGGGAVALYEGDPAIDGSQAYLDELDRFLDRVATGSTGVDEVEAAADVLGVIEAARRSCIEAREVGV